MICITSLYVLDPLRKQFLFKEKLRARQSNKSRVDALISNLSFFLHLAFITPLQRRATVHCTVDALSLRIVNVFIFLIRYSASSDSSAVN